MINQIQQTVMEMLVNDPDGVLEGLSEEEAQELLTARRLRAKLTVKFD